MSAPLPVVLLVASIPSAAHAQGLATHHPVIPAASVAAENGPGTLWVNPANLSYDRDPRYGIFVSRGASAFAPNSFSATAGTGAFGVGLHNLTTTVGEETRSDWSLDYGTGVALPERIHVGFLVSWNFVDGGDNYVGYDAGLSWRPLPWFGVGAVAQNISSPDPNGAARPRTGGGIALRPFGPFLVAGVDYARLYAADRGPGLIRDEDRVTATLRLRPVEGLYLRGGAEGTLRPDGAIDFVQGSFGVELYFGGFGGGFVQDRSLDSSAIGARTGWVGSDDPGESFVRSGRRVPNLTLDDAPPYESRVSFLSLDSGPSWLEVLERFRRVEEDRGIKGMVLTLGGVDLGWARFRELRSRIEALELAGKSVLVNLQGAPSNGEYYVATAASRVALHPAGNLDLVGLFFPLVHVRGALELAGIEPQYVRRDAYKSAPETFTRTEPSEPSLKQTHALLDDLFDELVLAIVQGRGIDDATVRELIDGGPYTAAEAVDAGLVDVLAYPDELEQQLASMHRGPVRQSDLLRMPDPHSAWESPAQIALIYVEGLIVPGESSAGGILGDATAGSQTIVRALQRASEEPLVRAVVLRVDSPGGSAFASDEIARAVNLVRDEGKPVVVSMGGVAASGGYYISAGADAIWAQPNTITGSIGVYSGKMVVDRLLDDIGVERTDLVRGRNADLDSPWQRWDDVQQARVQSIIDEVYRQFKAHVAHGRSMAEADVERVSGGRVWSGLAAQDVGLVDRLGGIQDAIRDARERAGLSARRKVGLVSYTSQGSRLEALAPSIVGRARAMLMPPSDRATLNRAAELLAPLGSRLIWTLYPEEQAWLLDERWTRGARP